MRYLIKESSFRKSLLKDMADIGFKKTSKKYGMSFVDLATIIGVKLNNPDIILEIIFELFYQDKLTKKFRDYSIDTERFLYANDVISWTYTGNVIDFESFSYATPFYDNVEGVPVETLIPNTDDTVDGFISFIPHFKSVDNIIKWWDDFYIPEVYKQIIENNSIASDIISNYR